jgi:hypothetical protein
MKQQKMIVVAVTLILALCIAAVAWPWGKVGINVDEPREQLDVGGNAYIRENLEVGRGDDYDCNSGTVYLKKIRMYSSADGEYKYTVKESGEDCIEVEEPLGAGISFSPRHQRLSMSTPNIEEYEYNARNFYMYPIVSPVTGVVFRVNNICWTNTP